MKEKIIIKNGYRAIAETQATLLTDKSNFVYAGDGIKVGYELYIEIDERRYPIRYDGSDFYVEMLGMTKEDWEKYGYDKRVK